MENLFVGFQDNLDKEQDMREQIRADTKEIEQYSRQMFTILQVVHSCNDTEIIAGSCKRAREFLTFVKESFKTLKAHTPKCEYYRFNDHWRHVMQQLSFLVAFIVFLEDNKLISREEFANAVGVESRQEDGFHIDLEDYLTGLLLLTSELSRLSVNCVTNGNYIRPLVISKFVGDLHSGFRLLNLKNDALRKRFDSLKYDVRKIEEVVYDLSLRGLIPGQHGTSIQAVSTENQLQQSEEHDV